MTLDAVLLAPHPDLPSEAGPGPSRGMVSHSDHGVATCHRCWWRGVPTIVGGELVHECPRCDVAPAAAVKAGRNDPCPCGSGVKFKRCCG